MIVKIETWWKLTSIEHPVVRYFAIFIARCLLPKLNATNASGPDMYVLYSAMKIWIL